MSSLMSLESSAMLHLSGEGASESSSPEPPPTRILESDDEELLLPPLEDSDEDGQPLDEDEEDSLDKNSGGVASGGLISGGVPSRVNKRKNFRPRNIVYNETSSQAAGPPNPLAAYMMNLNKSLLPRRRLEEPGSPEKETAPMDLSLSSFEDEATQSRRLSIVSPEVLYGKAANPAPNTVEAMKEAFQEILKLYGVPQELAELIAKNAQNFSGASSSSSTPPLLRQSSPEDNNSLLSNGLPSFPGGGLLSTALLGARSSGSSSNASHPPTPPRTPKASEALIHPFLASLGGGEAAAASSKAPPSPLTANKSSSVPQLLAGILPGSKGSSTDYTRYFKRFASASDCGSGACRDLSYREHFHCTVFMCRNRVFAKKEEMIRHAKWHQKLDEAYKYGFRRVTPMDDCTDQFPGCSHNRKQTHYHCIQSESCDKCYISTSDVQMHFNYHRKDNAIQREGFLRYRGHEDCLSPICPFRSQKTTHFHCNRLGCQFIFKNKADMEKHKSYHMKDEQMNEDGFRKYTRTDVCAYPDCRYSRKTNHIHCIREACGYVLNSSGELLTHKRKHERRDSCISKSSNPKRPPPPYSPFRDSAPPNVFPPTDMLKDRIPEDAWRNYLLHFEAAEICGFQNCDMEDAEHYHCKDEGCESIFRSEEGVKDHGRSHYLQDQVSDAFFTRGDPVEPEEDDEEYTLNEEKRALFCPEKCSNKTLHFHCKWDNCNEIIFNAESPFKRLEHYKIHEYTRKWNLNKVEPISMTQTTSVDTMFKRKRGRPPKNRVVEIPGTGFGGHDNTPQAVFTSFKLPKPGQNNVGFNNNSIHHQQQQQHQPFSPEALSAAAKTTLSGTSLGGLPALVSQLAHSPELPRNSPEPTSTETFKEEFQKGLIKAKGTYYPLTAFPTSMPQGPVLRQETASPPRCDLIPSAEDKSPPVSLKSKFGGVNFMVSFGRQQEAAEAAPTESALAKLLQASKDIVGDISAHPLFGPEPEEESCGRPFCKLKRRPHYHCNFCNQGFTERDKLETHLKKHTAENAKPSIASILHETKQPLPQEALVPKELTSTSSSSSANVSPPPHSSSGGSSNIATPTGSTSPLPFNFPNFLRSSFAAAASSSPSLGGGTSAAVAAAAASPLSSFPSFLPPPNMMLPGFPTYGGESSPSGGAKSKLPSYDPVQHPLTHLPPNIVDARKRTRSPSSAQCLEEEESKKLRVQAASMKTNKDEPVPEGYMRFRRSFRFNEDCGFEFCNYREHQTHFHCMRKDCNYRFCDKTRFVQHTARHERLDSLCGDEFEGFRGVTCGRDACEYNIVNMKVVVPVIGDTQKSSSHFHCLKCDYYCTDTNKVVAHRRQHQKLDSIMSAGFEKYSPSQLCSFEGCLHNNKQTHYHCKKCQYSVLGLSQMEAHKYRHLND